VTGAVTGPATGPATGPVIGDVERLDPDQVREVLALVERAAEADGMRPVSEHVWLHIRHGSEEDACHVLARDDDGRLIGYAHLDIADPADGASVELAVDPDHRRGGVGRALLAQAIDCAPHGRLRLWAHGEDDASQALAQHFGFARLRTLWQMRRSLFAPLPRAVLPEGVRVAPFRVGVDEQAWLEVNARAFVDLPDQGGWQRTDLDVRLNEPWFSPDGFLLAWREDALVGFHWTKVHGGVHEPIGEVYVLGIDPSARGTGLGRALTLTGLHHLRSLDLAQAMLYVDASNRAAIELYESVGFARWDTDVLYAR